MAINFFYISFFYYQTEQQNTDHFINKASLNINGFNFLSFFSVFIFLEPYDLHRHIICQVVFATPQLLLTYVITATSDKVEQSSYAIRYTKSHSLYDRMSTFLDNVLSYIASKCIYRCGSNQVKKHNWFIQSDVLI